MYEHSRAHVEDVPKTVERKPKVFVVENLHHEIRELGAQSRFRWETKMVDQAVPFCHAEDRDALRCMPSSNELCKFTLPQQQPYAKWSGGVSKAVGQQRCYVRIVLQ